VSEEFGMKEIPAGIKIDVPEKAHPYVPERDENHVHSMEFLADFLLWFQHPHGDGFAVVGPTGSGKTSGLLDALARLNTPVISVTANQSMTYHEMVGHNTVIEGTMMYVHGPLAVAMQQGFTLIINEFDLLDPGEVAGLNDVLEGRPLVIPENGGEIIKCHPNFRFIVTGNTNGSGDATGRYSGTSMQNMAFMDRFQVIQQGYLESELELAVLTKSLPHVKKDMAEKMVAIANEIRRQFIGDDENGGSLDVTMSTRTLLRWARLTYMNQSKANKGISPVIYALDRALGNRTDKPSREALHAMVQHHFGN